MAIRDPAGPQGPAGERARELRVDLQARHWSSGVNPGPLSILGVRPSARNEFIVSLADGPSLEAARVAIESLPDWTVAGVQSGMFRVGFRGPRDLRHMSEAALNNMFRAMNGDPTGTLPSLPAEDFRLVNFVAEGQEGRGGATGFLEVTAEFVRALEARQMRLVTSLEGKPASFFHA